MGWLAILAAAAGLTTVLAQNDDASNEPRDNAGEKAPADEKKDPQSPFPQRFQAPSLEGGLGWLNAAGSIELSKLKGKIVLLDFWTYCCINCMHILPDLAKLEEEFPNELVVIGVHSAKFDGEQVTENIRDAVRRYEIRHPVVNDGKMRIWQRYGATSWPTQVLIDPQGYYIGSVSGEGNYELLRGAIQKLITYHDKNGTLDKTPLHFQQESYGQEKTPLLYPGKIAIDLERDRLWIADSGHHRLVAVDLASRKLLDVIGDGKAGYVDGPFENVRFHEPQGMAIAGDIVYVADRKNHVVRRVDLAKREVRTIAGTGQQGHERDVKGPAREIPLGSPWALLLREGSLYIAMAGTHQIWKLDLGEGIVESWAGNGRENIHDGPREFANFAQPSGLAADADHLYVADSETSAIRKVHFESGVVESLVGQGLFEFGDVDGEGSRVRLQHPLGIAYADGTLYVADTYNNKIKTVDPATGKTVTFLGDGKAALSDDPPRFDEPAGLALGAGRLYVADTNNHAVRVVDLVTRKVTTLLIDGLAPPPETPARDDFPSEPPTEAPPATLKGSAEVTIHVAITLADGYKLNPDAPMSYQIRKRSEESKTEPIGKGKVEPPATEFDVRLAGVDLADANAIELAVTYFPCETSTEGVCRVETAVWRVPVSLAPDGDQRVELRK